MSEYLKKYNKFLELCKCTQAVFEGTTPCRNLKTYNTKDSWCEQCKLFVELEDIFAKYERLKINVADYLKYQKKIKAVEELYKNQKLGLSELIENQHKELAFRAGGEEKIE